MSGVMYGYRAVDTSGTIRSGVLPGDGPDSVAERIRRMGLRPISITRKRAQILSKDFALPGGGTKRADALAMFSRQLATMTDAGTPLLGALRVLEGQRRGRNVRLSTAVGMVRADVENGDPLSVALGRQRDWFDEFYVSMVHAGETAGSLPAVLERLAEATEARSRLRRKIRGAMAYPTAVAGLIVLAVIAMLTYLIPAFSDIFRDLGGTLPLPTRIVMGASKAVTGYFPVVLLALVVGSWGLRRWRRSPSGALRFDHAKLRLPVFGRLAKLASLARFARSLAVLVDTGVPVIDSLRIATTTTGNKAVSQALEAVARAVSNGGRLSEAMARHDVFTDVVIQMVSVGEDTGALDEMLTKVADNYELEVNTTVDSLTSLLEPLLIVLMGLVVGGVLFAVYLPMFNTISLIK